MDLISPSAISGGLVNVKAFGAVGDARHVNDGVTNLTTTVTSASAAFSSDDVGKTIFGTDTNRTTVLPRTEIVSVVNQTTVVVAAAAVGSSAGVRLVIGTNDTQALQEAAAAAESLSPRGTIYLPRGGYIFDETPFVFSGSAYNFKRPSIYGDGSGATFLYAAPDGAWTNDCVFNYDTINGSNTLRGFTLDGGYAKFLNKQIIFQSSSANYNLIEDVRVLNFSKSYGVYLAGATTMLSCHVEGMQEGRGIVCAGNVVTLINSYSGNNGYYSVDVNNGSGLVVIGGILDESTVGTISLGNGAYLELNGALVYIGGSYTGVKCNANNNVRATNSRIIPFGANANCTGIDVDPTSTVFLSQCVVTSSGTGVGIANAGTVYGGGNNIISSISGNPVNSSLP